MGDRVREARKYARGVVLLLALGACGRSSGCSGCDQEGAPFPDKDRIQSAVQVRLSEGGLTFLESNLEPILAQAIPEGLNVCIPGQGGDIIGLVQWGFCQAQCPDGNQGCPITIGIGGVDLQPVEPSTLRAVVNFEELSVDFDVAAEPIVSCSVSIRGPGFPVQVDLLLSTPEPTRDLTFQVANPSFRLADLEIRLQGDGGFLGPVCDAIDGVINFPIIGDLLFDVLQTFINGPLTDIINGFVEDFTCRTCDEANACPVEGGAVCDGGKCMLDGVCIPAPLGLEGRINVGDLLGGFSPGLDAPIDYLATPGSYAQVENQGLSLGIISGAVSPPNRCVPLRPQPENIEPPRAESLRGNVAPGGFPFEVGIGISELLVRHFLWAAFNSGALCLALTTDTIEQLSVGTLGIALPNLRALARGDAPIAITLSPQEVPIARFGANVVVDDPDDPGQRVLQEPLLTIEIPNLYLDFHLFMEDRWVRIFSLSADVEVPVGIDFTPDNEIIPMLGDLGTALRNVRAHNGEIMRDDPARLAALLPVLLRPLTSLVADGLLNPIALPDVMGYALNMQDGAIAGIEQNTFLGVFANLERAEMQPDGGGASFSVETEAEVTEVHVPPTEDFEADALDAWRRPYVRLSVDAFDGTTEDADMEFSWRVDHGTWSLFTAARDMVVRDPALFLQGRHRLEVRARRIEDYRTLDPTPVELEVLIDSIAPELTLTEAGDGAARVVASDWVTATDDLRLEARLDGGEWFAFDGDLLEAEGAARIEVRAADESGNESEAVLARQQSSLIGRLPPEERNGDGGGCGGCATSSGRPDLFAALLVLGGLGLLRRRRRAALLVALFVTAACDDESRRGDGDDEGEDGGPPGDPDQGPPNPGECKSDEECEVNEVCRDGACIIVRCNDDAQCNAKECADDQHATCNNMGVCECEPFCPDGCGDGEYCCLAEDECRPVPRACGDMTCDPGFELMVSARGEIDVQTCTLEGAECDCIEKMPLEAGLIGRYSDLVVAGDDAWVSAYAETYGDLVVGRRSLAGDLAWWWVDGVPADAEVTGAPSGPRGGVEDEGDDVGLYTALARGPEGELHVAYYDATHGALRYALGVPEGEGYTWTTRALDATGDAGRWASISLNARGVPGVAYRVARARAADGWFSEVRYVLARNARPSGDNDWNPPFTLQQTPREEPCGGECGAGEACVVSTDTCGRLTRGMCGDCAEGQSCVEGSCEAVAEFPAAPHTYPEGTGLFTTQARDLDGAPVVAWYDRTAGSLWLSRFVDAGFAEPERMAGWGHEDPDRDGDMGTNVDVAVDAEGNVHLCYQDGMTDSLRYLAPALDRDEWPDDGVRREAGDREHALHVVGEDCNMRLDANGLPVLVYQDATAADVVLARRDEAGNWVRRVLRGEEAAFEGSFGFYTRARVEAGKLWVSSYFYQNRRPPLSQALDIFSIDLP